MKHDRTFLPQSLYGSNEWTAITLGLAKDVFFRKRADLWKRGFPRPDPVTNLYLKADVQAWIEGQRRISGGTVVSSGFSGVRIDGI